MPPMQFPGAPVYARTAAQINAAVGHITASGAKTIGLDLEWNVDPSSKVAGPVAVIQLCWTDSNGHLQAAVLHVACVPRRMTGKLRALLQDEGVRKVTFGSFDKKRLEASYRGWHVAGLVDMQACLVRNFGMALGRDVVYPRLAEVTAWLLGWDLGKELQTANNWEGRKLRMLQLEAARVAAEGGRGAGSAAEGMAIEAAAAAAARAEARAAAKARAVEGEEEKVAAAAEAAPAQHEAEAAAGGAEQKRKQSGQANADEEPAAKEQQLLSPGTEPQEEMPPLFLIDSQPGGVQEGEEEGDGDQEQEEQEEREESQPAEQQQPAGEQLAEEAPREWAHDLEVLRNRHTLFSTWSKFARWKDVETGRQKRRAELLRTLLSPSRDSPWAKKMVEQVTQPDALPLPEPRGTEFLAARLGYY